MIKECINNQNDDNDINKPKDILDDVDNENNVDDDNEVHYCSLVYWGKIGIPNTEAIGQTVYIKIHVLWAVWQYFKIDALRVFLAIFRGILCSLGIF